MIENKLESDGHDFLRENASSIFRSKIDCNGQDGQESAVLFCLAGIPSHQTKILTLAPVLPVAVSNVGAPPFPHSRGGADD